MLWTWFQHTVGHTYLLEYLEGDVRTLELLLQHGVAYKVNYAYVLVRVEVADALPDAVILRLTAVLDLRTIRGFFRNNAWLLQRRRP